MEHHHFIVQRIIIYKWPMFHSYIVNYQRVIHCAQKGLNPPPTKTWRYIVRSENWLKGRCRRRWFKDFCGPFLRKSLISQVLIDFVEDTEKKANRQAGGCDCVAVVPSRQVGHAWPEAWYVSEGPETWMASGQDVSFNQSTNHHGLHYCTHSYSERHFEDQRIIESATNPKLYIYIHIHISCSLEIFPSANALVTSTSQFFAGYCRIPTFDYIHCWSPWWPGLARIRRWSLKAGSSVTRVTATWSVRYGRWESLRSSRRADGNRGFGRRFWVGWGWFFNSAP